MTVASVHWPGPCARTLAARCTAAIAAILYSSFLASYLVSSGSTIDFVSELERPGAPYADWYRVSDVLAGVLLLAMVALTWPAHRSGRRATTWALAAAAVVGVSSMIDGASRMDCAPSVQRTCDVGDHSVLGILRQLLVGHTLSGLTGFIAAGVGAALCARAAWSCGASTWMRVNIVLAAVIGACGLADGGLLLAQVDVATVERVRILVVSVWVVVVPWTTEVCARPAQGNRYAGKSARATLSCAGSYGGSEDDEFQRQRHV